MEPQTIPQPTPVKTPTTTPVATPATPTSFNPTNFITQARASGQSDDQIMSFLQTKGINVANPGETTDATKTPILGKTYLQRVGSDITSLPSEEVKTEEDAADEEASGGAEGGIKGLAKVGLGIGEAGVGSAWNALKTIISPLTEAPAAGIAETENAIANNKTVQNFATGDTGDKINSLQQQAQTLSAKHPEVAKFLSDTYNLATTLAAGDKGTDVADTGGTGNGPKVVENEDVTPSKEPPVPGSRIPDATPNYDKSMVLTNVRDASGNIVPRVAEESSGVFGDRAVTPSGSETTAGTELENVPNYPDKGTALEKGLAVQKEIGNESQSMRSSLQQEDTENPLDTDSEKAKVTNLVKKNLPPEIQKALGILDPEDQEFVNSMQKSAGLDVPEGGVDVSQPGEKGTLPKTAAGRYYAQVGDALNNYDGTRVGKLDLRQAIDGAFEKQGGKYAFGTDSQNALAENHADIRDDLNKDLHDTSDNTDTKASLQKQTNLYRALDILKDKAEEEGTSAFKRFQQKYPITQTVKRMILRRGIGAAL